MLNDLFNSSIFHHLFGCSKIIFVLSFHNYCLLMVILNNSVHVVKWKVFQQILGCNFHVFTGHSLHCTYHKQFLSIFNPHLMSSDSLHSSISLLWLCSEELPKSYQHFHGIHTYKLLETVYVQESPKGVLTRKILFEIFFMNFWNVIK